RLQVQFAETTGLTTRLLWLPASSPRLLFLNREPSIDQFVSELCAKVRTIDRGEEFVGLLCLCNRGLPASAPLTHPNPRPAVDQITFKPSVGIMKCNHPQVMTESVQRRQSLVCRACSYSCRNFSVGLSRLSQGRIAPRFAF